MRCKVLLYFLSVGMISGWAVNDSIAQNTLPIGQNPIPIRPLQPVMQNVPLAQPTMILPMPSMQPLTQPTSVVPPTIQPVQQVMQPQAVQNITPQNASVVPPTIQPVQQVMQPQAVQNIIPQHASDTQQPKARKGNSRRKARTNDLQKNKEVKHKVLKSHTEDRFKSRVREMMTSGSTELTIDEDYVGLNSVMYKVNHDPHYNVTYSLRYITDEDDVVNYIRNNVKTLVINGNVNIALEEVKNCDTPYTQKNIWFGKLEHVVLCNGSSMNVCQTSIQDRYDVTVKGSSIDFNTFFPGMRKLYWWPNFGKYYIQERSLELTAANQVKFLIDQSYNAREVFTKITFPKNVSINFSVFNLCNTIAVDCKSTKFFLGNQYYDYNRKIRIIMNGLQLVTKKMQSDIIYQLMCGSSNNSGQDLAIREKIRQNTEFIWPEGTVLEKPDFIADDALLLAKKAEVNASDEIYIKEGIKWIGGSAFAFDNNLPNNCFFNVTIPDSVIGIDQGAFSSDSIKDIIVNSERVKKLVQESVFSKKVIVDPNLYKTYKITSLEQSLTETQNKLVSTEKMFKVVNRRLENLEVFLMSVCEFEPFYDYLWHYSFETKGKKTYTGPQQWFKSYKKFTPHLRWPDEDNEPDLSSVTYADDDNGE